MENGQKSPKCKKADTQRHLLFFGGELGIRLARLRALGRSRSQQSTGLLLCTIRPSNP